MKRIAEILIFLQENTLESFDNAIHATEVLIFLRGEIQLAFKFYTFVLILFDVNVFPLFVLY
jgi:hypothetical protein